MAAAPGECDVERSLGLAGASYDAGDHDVAFRWAGEGDDLVYHSTRVDNYREVSIAGVWEIDHVKLRVSIEELEVAHADGAEQEAERVMRARIEGDDMALDVEQVRYHQRDSDSESFYVTWTNVYETSNGRYALEALFEGQRGATRWVYQGEGELDRDDAPFGLVELAGPTDAPHPILVTDAPEIIDLL